MGGSHGDRDLEEPDDSGAEPEDHAASDFVPEEFDTIPAHASGETTLLYLLAAATQLGQVFVTAWGLNRLSEPSLGMQDKIVAAVALIIALVVCIRAWSAAYHSAADDKSRERLRRGH